MFKKSITFTLVALVLSAALAPPMSVLGSATNYLDYYDMPGMVRLNADDGFIRGEENAYIFRFPAVWTPYVMADRVILPSDSIALEQTYFYCTSVTKRYKPAPLLVLTVYDKNVAASELARHTWTIQTLHYVYAFTLGASDPFANKEDQGVFTMCYNYIDSVDEVRTRIDFLQGDGEIRENTVIANDTVLDTRMIQDALTYYAPLRETCNALGYSVSWLESNRAIIIRNESFYDILYIDQGATSIGIPLFIQDGTTYVSIAYFYRTLAHSVNVDGNNILTIQDTAG